jgi:hypothetical protein
LKSLEKAMKSSGLSDKVEIIEGAALKGKAALIFPIPVTAIIVFVTTAAVTLMDIGLCADFVSHWLSNFLVGWPVAAATAYLVFPIVRRATMRIVAARR